MLLLLYATDIQMLTINDGDRRIYLSRNLADVSGHFSLITIGYKYIIEVFTVIFPRINDQVISFIILIKAD